MTSVPSNNVWIRRQQCPCGDWKCYLTHEGDSSESPIHSNLVKTQSSPSKKSMVSPYVGMIFDTDDEAFKYYCNFARKNGFSIRLSPQFGIYKRDFVCYRSGFAPSKKKPSVEHHRDRKSVRCGCDAKMYLSKELVDGVSKWFVVQFSNIHNHELLEDDQIRLLPAYRKIHQADQERILLLSKAGFPIYRIVKVLELEKGIQGGQLPFLERDVRNFVQSRKRVVHENDVLISEKRESDVIELLEACKATKEGDEEFVYDFTVDENDKVENIAWSYGVSVNAYNLFGDVVYFNTTYSSITYGMLFGAWLGIDNHGRTVFFSCVLLHDETPHSFSWALQTFISFMKGRCPQTILTDLDPGLREAIRSELPSTTKHVISIWNISSKLSSWLSLPLGSCFSEFKSEFNALYCLESMEDFEFKWNQMVSVFDLVSDKHVHFIIFFTVSMGTFLYKRLFPCSNGVIGIFQIRRFLLERNPHRPSMSTQLFRAVDLQINHGPQEMQYMQFKTSLPMEEHARSVLTPFAFNAFQNELSLAMQYSTSEMGNGSYLITHFKKMDSERLVIWIPNEEQIHCYCKEFESSGLLCRHARRLFISKNYFQIPEKYYLSRWRWESSLAFHEDQVSTTRQSSTNEDWFDGYQCLTESVFSESSTSRERSDYVRGELMKEMTRILNEIRSMLESDVHNDNMDLALSPTC